MLFSFLLLKKSIYLLHNLSFPRDKCLQFSEDSLIMCSNKMKYEALKSSEHDSIQLKIAPSQSNLQLTLYKFSLLTCFKWEEKGGVRVVAGSKKLLRFQKTNFARHSLVFVWPSLNQSERTIFPFISLKL